MNKYIKALQDYAKALREAAAAERLLGPLMMGSGSFADAMEQRAHKVELILGRRTADGEFIN